MTDLEHITRVSHQQTRIVNIKKRSTQKQNLVGNYRIGKKIGSGAYGTVHEAFQIETGEKFAAKVVYFNDSNYEAVRNEVKISQQLSHENIVRVEEVIEVENKIYLIMEFCENGELFEFVKSRGPMKEEQAAKIFMQIFSAVKYLHLKKIAHRDIKTENVLLDSNMNAKLIDFGFSKEYTSEDPMMETFCGSPSYVSPEIIKKQKYNGEKVDVWSLGITLYIMLEAAEPFFAQSNADTKFRIINYQWSSPKYSCSEAKQLYENVFVPASCRISLSEMQNSSYFEKYFQSQKRGRIESKSTQKTERMSTGDGSSIMLPGIITTNKKRDKYLSLKTPTESEAKDVDIPINLNFRNTKNKFDRKERSADLKTQRIVEFRVKITPTKPHKKQSENNVAFFKREIISSLNEY